MQPILTGGVLVIVADASLLGAGERSRILREDSVYRDNLAFAQVTPRERAVAFVVVTLCSLSMALIAPISGRAAGELDAFVAVIATATSFALVLTAVLLRGQYRIALYPPLAILSLAYATTGAIVGAYLLTFPRVFAPTGLFGAGAQTAAWLYVAWHVAFLVLAGAFVICERWCARVEALQPTARVRVRWFAAAVLMLGGAGIYVAIAHDAMLPALVAHGKFTAFYRIVLVPPLLALNVAVLVAVVVATRLRTVVALWLSVVLFATLCEQFSTSVLPGGRFSVGWYFARAEWIVASMTFYFALKGRISHILETLSSNNQTLYQTVLTDELTGLLNKRGFESGLVEVARRSARRQEPFTVIAIDVDQFKLYNDTFGHPAGDGALRSVGAALRKTMRRPEDVCGRTGGEEFSVLLADTTLSGALDVAERMRSAVEGLELRHASGAMHQTLTVSLGIATHRVDLMADHDDVVARADAALYESKRSGRNRITVAPAPSYVLRAV